MGQLAIGWMFFLMGAQVGMSLTGDHRLDSTKQATEEVILAVSTVCS